MQLSTTVPTEACKPGEKWAKLWLNPAWERHCRGRGGQWARQRRGRHIRFDRFVLYPDRGVLLSAEGREIALRPKAFTLLRLLVENAGRLLDRDTIMRVVWSDVIISDDGITQCVRDIRRALADDAQRILRTVRQRGYILAAEVSRDT